MSVISHLKKINIYTTLCLLVGTKNDVVKCNAKTKHLSKPEIKAQNVS